MGHRRTAGRLAVLVALLVVMLLTTGMPAWAHASFVSATPRPGTGLPQAPGEVVLRFTEPLIRDASGVTVRDPSGAEVVDGPTRPVEGDQRAMRRSIGLLPPGVYTVEWTTVSPLDGHTLKGSYRFAVGSSTTGEAVVSEDPWTSEGPVGLAGTWLALAGLALWFGTTALRAQAHDAGVADQRRRRLRTVAVAATAAGAAASLGATAVGVTASWSALWNVVLGSPSGRWSLAVVVVALTGLILRRHAGPRVDLVLATVAVFAEAASGHAGSNPTPWLAAVTFTVHVAVAGIWVSAVVLALLAGRPRAAALRSFTRAAVVAAAAAGVTGVASAWLELTAFSDLTATAYGQTVLAKVAAFIAMALVGFEHWRRRRRAGDDARVGWLVRTEAVVAAGVLGIATVLVGFPNPPREAALATAANDPISVLEATLQQPAVTVGGRSGPYVVGVTVTPPRPGPVDVVAQVEGVGPGDGLRDVELAATGPSGDTRVAPLEECGSGCFRGSTTLSGRGRFQLRVRGATNGDPLDTTVEVDLPAEDGTSRFDAMLRAMGELKGARIREDLRSRADAAPIISSYQFSAPDRMRWDVDPASQAGRESTRIAIGDTGYLTDEDEPDGWKTYDWVGDPFTWPVGFYEEFFVDATAIREIGTDTIDGDSTTILSMAQTAYPAWYRLWIDDQNRLRRLEMLADGHFMDQYFRDLDTPVRVQPPDVAKEPR